MQGLSIVHSFPTPWCSSGIISMPTRFFSPSLHTYFSSHSSRIIDLSTLKDEKKRRRVSAIKHPRGRRMWTNTHTSSTLTTTAELISRCLHFLTNVSRNNKNKNQKMCDAFAQRKSKSYLPSWPTILTCKTRMTTATKQNNVADKDDDDDDGDRRRQARERESRDLCFSRQTPAAKRGTV